MTTNVNFCFTCDGRGYYLCSRGDVKCHVCNGTGKIKPERKRKKKRAKK